jgi:16S rRNA (cytosine1402-N4)-methyltransferase
VEHDPVFVDRVVGILEPTLRGGGVVVDATLGRAGHARALLDAAPRAQLLGIDRDPDAVEESRAHLAPFGNRARVVRGDFQELTTLLERLGDAPVRGVLFDLGVSSPQLDDPRRGFGWRSDGPLDMRMDPSQSVSASDVVNGYPSARLERVIRNFGEERFARRIAAAIVRRRPIESTGALAEVVRAAIPAAARRTGRHPARRTFQALRIEVNQELAALEVALPDAVESLSVGGRVVAISYHSLEDRIVKRTFAEQANNCVCPPDLPVCACGAEARVRILTRRPERPSAQEVERNPRARAAKLRAAERLAGATGAPDS